MMPTRGTSMISTWGGKEGAEWGNDEREKGDGDNNDEERKEEEEEGKGDNSCYRCCRRSEER